jgi:hypothetical protein
MPPVPQSEGEHPNEPFEGCFESPLNDGRQHHLRIRVAAKCVPLFFPAVPQIAKVVYLPVENDDVSATCREHRLMSFRREVDNGETTVRKGNARVRIDPHS